MTRPCTAAEAVARAKSITGKGGQYVLGTGDWNPRGPDVPWTTRDGLLGSDCAGFAFCWAYKVVRHRPGFNKGPWASVSDDINCNSLIEDADHAGDLVERIDWPELGCLLTYPTIRIGAKRFIGHIEIVTDISRVTEWDASKPNYSLLGVAACRGPNERKPGVIAGHGGGFNGHDKLWGKPEHRTVMLRVKP